IQVETEAGVGSKFAVRLPIEPSPKAQPSNIITSGPADNDDQGDRPQILIVEDNADTQELMLLILRDKYEVTITSNASETLLVIENRTFDAILMDLNLGGRRTGFELIRELRQVNTYESVPVLAVSALPIGVIRKQLIREGFNGYIAKPFTRARILDALEGVLNLTQ
ncbi:MAG: response regulator, partial [Rhodothermales bacterium]